MSGDLRGEYRLAAPSESRGSRPAAQNTRLSSVRPLSPPSARSLRMPPLHLPSKSPVSERRMKRRGSALGKCKGQFHRANYLYSLPMFELPCTSLHKELLCWCYTRLFIGPCVAGCTWGLASSLPFTFPCELSIHCPAKEGGWGASGLTFCHQ